MSDFALTIPGGESKRLKTGGKYCPDDIVVTAEGTALPELTNPGTAVDLMDGKQMIDGSGNVVDGSFTITEEISEQDSLIEQIKTALRGKASGGGSSDNIATAIVDRTVTEYIDSKCTSVEHSAFRACTKLKTVDVPNATTVADYSFYQCSELTTLDLPSVTSIGQQVIYGCNKLKSLVLPSVTTMSQNAFREAQYLEVIDFHQLTAIPAQTFYGCRGLKTLILRSETMVTLGNTSAFTSCYRILGTKNAGFNPNGEKIGFIYVPAALLEEYRNATNWSNDSLVTQFRAIEDYPEICG